jgi:hypothetical protein
LVHRVPAVLQPSVITVHVNAHLPERGKYVPADYRLALIRQPVKGHIKLCVAEKPSFPERQYSQQRQYMELRFDVHDRFEESDRVLVTLGFVYQNGLSDVFVATANELDRTDVTFAVAIS